MSRFSVFTKRQLEKATRQDLINEINRLETTAQTSQEALLRSKTPILVIPFDFQKRYDKLLEACKKARTCRSINSDVDALLRDVIAEAKNATRKLEA